MRLRCRPYSLFFILLIPKVHPVAERHVGFYIACSRNTVLFFQPFITFQGIFLFPSPLRFWLWEVLYRCSRQLRMNGRGTLRLTGTSVPSAEKKRTVRSMNLTNTPAISAIRYSVYAQTKITITAATFAGECFQSLSDIMISDISAATRQEP